MGEEHSVSYSSIKWFEDKLSAHRSVERWSRDRQRDVVFDVFTKGVRVRFVLVNIYRMGASDCLAVLAKYDDVQAIVQAGEWNGFTAEAARIAMDSGGVRVFLPSSFFRALRAGSFSS